MYCLLQKISLCDIPSRLTTLQITPLLDNSTQLESTDWISAISTPPFCGIIAFHSINKGSSGNLSLEKLGWKSHFVTSFSELLPLSKCIFSAACLCILLEHVIFVFTRACLCAENTKWSWVTKEPSVWNCRSKTG